MTDDVGDEVPTVDLQAAYKRYTEWNANNYGSALEGLRALHLDPGWVWLKGGRELVLEAWHPRGGVVRVGDAFAALPENIDDHRGWSAAYYSLSSPGELAKMTTADSSTAGLVDLVTTLLEEVLDREDA